MHTLPNFEYEKTLWSKGFDYVAGCDEVGRGCFAGPVVTAVVVFAPTTLVDLPSGKVTRNRITIDDSKKLTHLQRAKAADWIKAHALGWGVGLGTVAEINTKGISAATHSGFRRSVNDCNGVLQKYIQFLLIDAIYIPYVRHLSQYVKCSLKSDLFISSRGRQHAIVGGDGRSFSIAAASIIAKVYRDDLMTQLAENAKYTMYGWHKNKGYGTKDHCDAIIKYGATSLHRKAFVATFLSKKYTTKNTKQV